MTFGGTGSVQDMERRLPETRDERADRLAAEEQEAFKQCARALAVNALKKAFTDLASFPAGNDEIYEAFTDYLAGEDVFEEAAKAAREAA